MSTRRDAGTAAAECTYEATVGVASVCGSLMQAATQTQFYAMCLSARMP